MEQLDHRFWSHMAQSGTLTLPVSSVISLYLSSSFVRWDLTHRIC